MDTTLFGRGWVNKVPFDWTQRTQRHYALHCQYPDHHHRRHHYQQHHHHHHRLPIPTGLRGGGKSGQAVIDSFLSIVNIIIITECQSSRNGKNGKGESYQQLYKHCQHEYFDQHHHHNHRLPIFTRRKKWKGRA